MADDITKLTEKLTGETTTLRQAKTLLTYDYTNFSRGELSNECARRI